MDMHISVLDLKIKFKNYNLKNKKIHIFDTIKLFYLPI